MQRPKKKTSKLTLGWRVNEDLEPSYWLSPGAKSGRQPDSALVTAPTEAMEHHTIIVAQSGSGKSFFLGRLIEEILLMSRSRVVILDPNSDFRKFNLTVGSDKWSQAKYDLIAKEGALPHESNQREFKQRWTDISKRIYSAQSESRRQFVPFQVDWLNFSIDWFADDADFTFRGQLQHCHNFVNEIRVAIGRQSPEWRRQWRRQGRVKLLDFSQKLCGETANIGRTTDKIINKLKEQFTETKGLKEQFRETKGLKRNFESAARYRTFFGNEAEQFYFGFAREALDSGIFAGQWSDPTPSRPDRLHVIDLVSIRHDLFRMMAVGSFLAVEWKLALKLWEEALEKKRDTRVPLFIVLDEAHEIIPAQPTSLAHRRLKEWFRVIAAEGRKFGVFLILVSQRPDKIDPSVVSECENRAIMKIGSELVLEEASNLLGLSAIQRNEAKQCLTFSRGRALLCGPWAGRRHLLLYTAMRRTVEGGRNLRPQYWARPQ